MDHQIDGVAELLHNYRWALQWEMGTGKSKVVIDTAVILKEQVLILCPLVAIQNWNNEIQKHSGGTLRTVLFDGKSTKQKKKQLRDALGADVYIATYDTARLYGVPTMFSETAKLFNKARRVPNIKMREALMNLNDKEKQLAYAQQLLDGRANSEILAEIEQITQALPTCLEHLPYKIIVADESHRIKRIQSKRTRFCLQLSAKAPRRYLLSGTLSLGDPRDLYPQLQFLAPYLMPEDWTTFCKNHLVTRPGQPHIVVQYKNIDVVNKRVTLVSSTRKLDECIDLPERRFVTIDYNFTHEQLTEYDRAAADFKIMHWKQGEIDIAHSAIAVAKLLQICSGFVYVPVMPDKGVLLDSQDMTTSLAAPEREAQRFSSNNKLSALTDLLDDLVGGQGGKVIVWANYVAELDDIEAALKLAGYTYVRVDGTTASRIQGQVDEFQNNPKCQIYLAQEKTGIAITLTAAKYSIYYSRSWSLEDHQQSLFRNYRIGQTQKTVVYHLIASGTIEEQQLDALNNKQHVADLLTQRHECVLCRRYRSCLDTGIKPWDDFCGLTKDPHRVVTKPTPLKED
jgi:SNF2 family DNA or RNA helicase